MVEFIGYTGRYPCLCLGDLTLRIDGEEITLERPLFSRGFVASGPDGDMVEKGAWVLDKSAVPDKYKNYVDEIEKCANENVPLGCCGGCL